MLDLHLVRFSKPLLYHSAKSAKILVLLMGVEPIRAFAHRSLSFVCLPISSQEYLVFSKRFELLRYKALQNYMDLQLSWLERSPVKRRVAGSSPAGSAKYVRVGKWFKPPDFLSGNRGFESHLGYQIYCIHCWIVILQNNIISYDYLLNRKKVYSR